MKAVFQRWGTAFCFCDPCNAMTLTEQIGGATVCCILSVAYRLQLDQPAGYLQDCAPGFIEPMRYLLDLHGLMAYKDVPALRYTLHRHHGFADIQSGDQCDGRTGP